MQLMLSSLLEQASQQLEAFSSEKLRLCSCSIPLARTNELSHLVTSCLTSG